MGLFTILKTVKDALPSIWDNVANPLITNLIHSMGTMDMMGGNVDGLNLGIRTGKSFNLIGGLDDPVSEADKKQEEVLVVTHQEITQRQLQRIRVKVEY